MTRYPVSILVSLATFAVAPLIGATQQQTCLVEAYCSPDAPSRCLSYRLIIEPIPTVCRELDVEAARDLARAALSAHGMFEAPAGTPAQVDVSFAIDMWEQILPARNTFLRFRPVTEGERLVVREIPDDDGGMQKVREKMVVPLNHGYGPAQQAVGEVRRYQKRLSLAGRAPEGTSIHDGSVEWWRVEVATCDKEEEITSTLPIMLSAAMDRIGTRSNGREEVVLSPSDKAVQFVSAGW